MLYPIDNLMIYNIDKGDYTLERYLDLLKNNKDYERVVEKFCQTTIKGKLLRALDKIVKSYEIPKFNGINPCMIDIEIVSDSDNLYVEGVYQQSYIHPEAKYNATKNTDGYNSFKFLISEEDIVDDFKDLSYKILDRCVDNFIVLNVGVIDKDGNHKLINSIMTSFYKKDIQNINKLALLTFARLNDHDIIYKMKCEDFVLNKLKITDGHSNKSLITVKFNDFSIDDMKI